MKYNVPIIVSLACVAVQALPIPDARGPYISLGANNLFSDANSLFGGATDDVSKLLGSVTARSKRGLLDGAVGIEAIDGFLNTVTEDAKDNNVNKVIDDAYKTLVARSPDKETEDATDCSETDGSADDSESDQNNSVESSGETGDDSGGAVPNNIDDSSLVDDSSLTANEAENAVSAEAGDQTDLSRRTVVASAGNLITGIGSVTPVTITTTGSSLGHDLGKIEGVVITA